MAETTPSTPEQESPRQSATTLGGGRPSARRSKAGRNIVLVLVAIIVVVGGIVLYRHLAAWESTDDAEIDGYIYPISSRITGYVTRVMVDDNQYVKAGTVLVRLDPEDYDVAVANAKATLANDQAAATASQTNVPLTSVSTSSQLSSAQADVDNAQAGLMGAQHPV